MGSNAPTGRKGRKVTLKHPLPSRGGDSQVLSRLDQVKANWKLHRTYTQDEMEGGGWGTTVRQFVSQLDESH